MSGGPSGAGWAVTVGRSGVHLNPAPGHDASGPPEMVIGAVLPDGTEVFPIPERIDDEGSPRYRFVFDPELPDGSVVTVNGAALTRIGPPGSPEGP